MAPEIFTGSYGLECDMWSLGVILFVLMNGKYPFDGNNAKEVVQNIRLNDCALNQKNGHRFPRC